MVRKPTWPPEMEDEGRRYAESHPEERRRVLEACDEAAGAPINRERAEVLICGNAALVKPYSFWIHKNTQGEWEARPVVF